MNVRTALDPRRNRGQGIVLLVAVPVIGAVGAATWFAANGPGARAGAIASALAAVASATAALTALALSRQALARTDQQLAHALHVMMLSRYPLLLPIHQSVSFPASADTLAAHPPTAQRFRLNPPEAGRYAFLAEAKNTFVVPMENAGEGPALAVCATLWHRDGRNGRLVGPTIVAASRTAVFSVALSEATARLPEAFADALRELNSERDFCPYWLEIRYLDIFGNELRNEALFDPRGLGAWHVTTPANEVTNAGRSASL